MMLPLRPHWARTVTVARVVALVAAAVLLVGVQMGGLGRWRLFGVYPDLLVVAVCSVALQRGPWAGVGAAFVFGLLADIAGGHLVGLSVLCYAAAALVAGPLGLRAFPERWIVTSSAVALGTAASQLAYVLGAKAFGYDLAFWQAGPRIIGALVLYHWLLTPPTFLLIRSLLDMIWPRRLDA